MYTEEEILNLKKTFIDLLKSTERKGIDTLIDYLENKTDFFSAPASSKFHNNFPGGLVAHSLNVYNNFKSLLDLKEVTLDNDSIILCSLLHDLCKCNFYVKDTRNRKVNGKWEQYEVWSNIQNPSVPLPHSSRSIRILKSFIQIKFIEEIIIFYHMGPYGGEDYEYKNLLKQVNEQYPQSLLFYVSDTISSYIDETTEH